MSTDETTGASASDSVILIHIWELLDPSHEGTVSERLDAMLSEVSRHPGLVSARLLSSDNGRSMATILHSRSPEDQRELEQLPVVRKTLDDLAGTLNIVVRRYREKESYPPSAG
jgi:hypothetical protein